jgi:crotonobetainyl-CoA:carnitine CoA-transferase CaiB-like acyl-CoA transferase
VLDEIFRSQPMSHWGEVFDQAHLTFGVVHAPSEVVKDPQLRENDIVVPIEGAGERVKFTVSSPLTVHNVSKVAARRAPEIGEHNDELLQELGFSSEEIGDFRASGAIPHAQEAEVLGGVR